MEYLMDSSGIWPGAGYPKDIFWGFWDIHGPNSENLEWDIPYQGKTSRNQKTWNGISQTWKPMNDKSRVSFFVLGYLSLSHPILVLIRFRLIIQHNAACRSRFLPGSAQWLLHFATHCTRRSPRTSIFVSIPGTRLRRSGGDWGRVRCSSSA